MSFKQILVAATLMLGSIFSLHAEIVIVVHPSNAAAIDAKSVQKMFLGKEKKFSTGVSVTPINLQAANALRAQFDESIVGRNSSQVAAYWSKLVFTGKGVPPTELSSEVEVISAVAADPSAIGYVDASSLNDTVKVISIK